MNASLSKFTVPELKQLCRDRGCRGYSRKRKAEIIALLRAHAKLGIRKMDGKKCPPCPSDKVCNHKTGRCVKKTGRIGRKLLAGQTKLPRRSKKIPRKCPPCTSRQICNPKSGFCVKKKGKVGQRLLARQKVKPKKVKIFKELQPKDIMVFYQCGRKARNDELNKIRETILRDIGDPDIVPQDMFDNPVYGPQWVEIARKWHSVVKSLYQKQHDAREIEQMAGRKYNYDFRVLYIKNGATVHESHVEFKFNSKNIESLPQFLQVAEKIRFIPECYAEYFYMNYLDDVISLLGKHTWLKPSKKEYMKWVYRTRYSIHPMFQEMYKKDKKGSTFYKRKNELVNKSIRTFLDMYASNIDINSVAKKIRETQEDKVYVMWDCSTLQFYVDRLPDQGRVLKYKGVLNDNTVILETRHGDQYRLLLRWKNHKGVLLPAWQISYRSKQN